MPKYPGKGGALDFPPGNEGLPQPPLQVRGTTFVLTKAMWQKRDELVKRIMAMGGRVDKAVRNSRTLLVVGRSGWSRSLDGTLQVIAASAKARAARSYGARIIHEGDLNRMLASGDPTGFVPPEFTEAPSNEPEDYTKAQAALEDAAGIFDDL